MVLRITKQEENSIHKGTLAAIEESRKYNSKEITYFGKGVATAKWFHATRRRDFMVFVQGGEAPDEFL